ncbi:MAG: hypothetical protein JNK78_05210 [Planctomycetes bacterium]|nr:hypothetical protein [Planctomycetota bacterium]
MLLFPRRSLLSLLTVLAVASAVRAQCTLSALPGDGPRQVQGTVDAVATFDPDGAGPLPLQLVAGGTFDVANVHGEHVVMWDGTAWTPTGANFGHVSQLIVWNGLLVAAAEELLYTFDGTTWNLLAGVEEGSPTAPLPGVVNALTLWNGDLVVGGRFTRVTAPFVSQNANMVAKLNASTGWSALGAGPTTTGMTGPQVRALAIFNNTVWAGLGCNTNFSNTPTLQFLNASAWNFQGTEADPVDALAARIGLAITSSWLFVARHALFASSVSLVGINPVLGTTTSITAPPAAGTASIDQIFVRGTGVNSYEVACTITPSGTNWARVWRWTASGGWTSLPLLFVSGPVRVGYFGGRYVAGVHGWSADLGSVVANDSVAGAWVSLLGPGFDSYVLALCHDGADLVIGGRFTTAGATAANRIARGHPNAWSPVGQGFADAVLAVVRMPNGDLVAGGSFLTLGDGTPMNHIARWNGSSWSPLGVGLDGDVQALLALPNGDLVAAGKFLTSGATQVNYVARWNGSTWSSLGGGCSSWVYALALAANGDILVGGTFGTAGTTPAVRVARWNGVAWSGFGAGLSGVVWTLAETTEGLVAGGEFLNSGGVPMPHVAKWDGNFWQPLDPTSSPSQPIVAITGLPGGGVVVGGAQFSVPIGGSPVSTCAATWRGSWGSLDVQGSGVWSLQAGIDGGLAVGGIFTSAFGDVSVNVATIVTSCPASASTFAPGCPSSGGSNTLSAVTLPWANGTFRAEATGLPANAIVLGLTSLVGVTPGVPLSALFAEGVPGCNLNVAPDILTAQFAVAGKASTEFFLPNVPPIVGVTFYHQMIPIEFDALTGVWIAITATNALQLTGGTF